MLSKSWFAAFLVGLLAMAVQARDINSDAPHRRLLAMAGFSDSPMPKVISFGADWCPSCDELKPSIDKAKGRYHNEIDFVAVNIDDPKNSDLVRLYRVRGIPWVVFVDPRGKVVSSFDGNQPKGLREGLKLLLTEDTKAIAAASKSQTQ